MYYYWEDSFLSKPITGHGISEIFYEELNKEDAPNILGERILKDKTEKNVERSAVVTLRSF